MGARDVGAGYDARVTSRPLHWSLAALACALALGCSRTDAVEGSASMAATAEVVLRVDGMTCAACETTISTRLEEEPGIVSCAVDHAAGTARVAFDPTKVQATRIADAIRDAGYEVK